MSALSPGPTVGSEPAHPASLKPNSPPALDHGSPLTPCSDDSPLPPADVPPSGTGEQQPPNQQEVAADPRAISVDGKTQDSYEKVTTIPPEIYALFPFPEDSVESLISPQSPFKPRPIGGKVLPLARSCIVDDGVQWNKDELLTAPIPPHKWLGDLEHELKGQLSAGRYPTAVQHPTIPTLRLPLWIANLWFTIRVTAAQKRVWTEAMAWLASGEVQGEEVDRASELIKDLTWGTTVWPLPEPITHIGLLAELLSTRWLRERHLDLWGLYLTHRAGEDANTYYIGGVHIAEFLKGLPKAKKEGKVWAESGSVFDTLARVIREGYTTILLPAHINGNHWVLFRIDLEKKTFAYGTIYLLSRYGHGN